MELSVGSNCVCVVFNFELDLKKLYPLQALAIFDDAAYIYKSFRMDQNENSRKSIFIRSTNL